MEWDQDSTQERSWENQSRPNRAPGMSVRVSSPRLSSGNRSEGVFPSGGLIVSSNSPSHFPVGRKTTNK